MIQSLTARQASAYRQKIKKSPCVKTLGSGSQATTQKVCMHRNCTECFVTKFGKASDDVTASEGLVLEQISRVVPKKDPQNAHIQQFRKMQVLPMNRKVFDSKLDRPAVLESEYVPTVMDMQAWLSSNRRENREELMTYLTQIFSTLAHISERVPGFLHMDVKPANVALRKWPKAGPEHLVVDGHRLELHEMPQWPVLIDFGTARTLKQPTDSTYGAMSEWLGACYFEGFDVFRLLVTVAKSLPKSHTSELHAVHSILEKQWASIKDSNVRQLKRLVKNRNFQDKSTFALLGRACKEFSIDFPTQAQAAMLCYGNLQRPGKASEFFLL